MNMNNNTILITGGTSGIGFDKVAMQKIECDTFEIRPAQGNALKMLNKSGH